MIDHAQNMRGQRAEKVVVDFLAEMLKVKRAREQFEAEMLTFADQIPFYFYAVRQACGLMTQQGLAEELGVNHSYISKVENGAILPQVKHLDSILVLLKKHGFEWNGAPFSDATKAIDGIGSDFEKVWRRDKVRETFPGSSSGK